MSEPPEYRVLIGKLQLLKSDEERMLAGGDIIQGVAKTVGDGNLRRSVEICLLAAVKILMDEGATSEAAYSGIDMLLTALAERTDV